MTTYVYFFYTPDLTTSLKFSSRDYANVYRISDKKVIFNTRITLDFACHASG